jgi:hypothetical protein
MSENKSGSMTGVVAGYMFAIAVILVGLYLLFCLADPVFEKIGESIGIISQALNVGGGDDFHSLAVLCIVGILIVGLAKVLTRRK